MLGKEQDMGSEANEATLTEFLGLVGEEEVVVVVGAVDAANILEPKPVGLFENLGMVARDEFAPEHDRVVLGASETGEGRVELENS